MYTPSKGIFVNGRIADAADMVNEFSAIATGIIEIDNKVTTAADDAEKTSIAHTDARFNDLVIDGGVF